MNKKKALKSDLKHWYFWNGHQWLYYYIAFSVPYNLLYLGRNPAKQLISNPILLAER